MDYWWTKDPTGQVSLMDMNVMMWSHTAKCGSSCMSQTGSPTCVSDWDNIVGCTKTKTRVHMQREVIIDGKWTLFLLIMVLQSQWQKLANSFPRLARAQYGID